MRAESNAYALDSTFLDWPLRLLVGVLNIEVVLVRKYYPMEVRQEPLRNPEVAF